MLYRFVWRDRHGGAQKLFRRAGELAGAAGAKNRRPRWCIAVSSTVHTTSVVVSSGRL
ncbi:protein of unknown function [Cupriavidus taiwanensis]|nr:protein of unknown function [Cupriavidus taiwanensis]